MISDTPSPASPASELKRRLGLDAALALLVGEVIGVGIFLTTAGMVASLGSPSWILTVWLFMGGAMFCGALCFAELAARLPDAGGPYVYLREAWGPLPAFLYGWKCLLVMDPGLTAALAAGFAANLAVVIPLSPAAGRAVAVTAVAALAGVNLAGTAAISGVVRWLSASKVLLLVGLVAWGFASGAGSWGHFLPLAARRAGAGELVSALAGGVVAAFFSFGGWWETTKIAGEMRDPARALPLALALGVGGVTVLYLLTSAVFVYLVAPGSAGEDATFAAQAGSVLVGPWGSRVLGGAVALFALGSLASVVTLCPRVYYALAKDGAFFASVGRVSPKTGTPARAVLVQAALAIALLFVGTFQQIVAWFIFVTVAFLGLTGAGLFVLRRRAASPAFAAPVFEVVGPVFLASIVLIMVLLAAGSPKQAALGSAVVALGVPAFYLRRMFA